MKKLVGLALLLCLVAVPVAMADGYYATKADYHNGVLTPGTPPAGGGGSLQGGDTCASPPTNIPGQGAGGMFMDTGTTVGADNTVGTLPIACNGNYTTVGGEDVIYEFTTGAAASPTFTVATTSLDYDPSIYLTTTCGNGTTCPAGAGADNCFAANAGGNPCGAVSTESFGPIALAASTQHFFYVDSFYAAGGQRSAGPYNLTVAGALPVELIDFSVE